MADPGLPPLIWPNRPDTPKGTSMAGCLREMWPGLAALVVQVATLPEPQAASLLIVAKRQPPPADGWMLAVTEREDFAQLLARDPETTRYAAQLRRAVPARCVRLLVAAPEATGTLDLQLRAIVATAPGGAA